MSLFENQEQIRPFRCPACQEYLAAGVTDCRFCGSDISQDVARAAARSEALGNRIFRRHHYIKHLRLGGALLLLGLAIMIASYFFFQKVFETDLVWIPRGLILTGGGDSLYGIFGLVSEARSAKRDLI